MRDLLEKVLIVLFFGMTVALQAQSPVDNHFTPTGTQTSFLVDDQNKRAQRFTAEREFNKLEIHVKAEGDNAGVIVSLYRWRGAYNESAVDATRQLVKRQTFDVKGDQWLSLDLPPQPPGMYLWELTPAPDKASVSVYGFEKSTYPGGESYTNGQSGKQLEVHSAGGVPENLGAGDNAQMFVAQQPFNEIRVLSPTWNDETGTKGYTMKLFPWKGDYESSIKEKPIAVQKVMNFKDNAQVSFFFPLQPPGEYLWVATEPVKPPVGHWRGAEDTWPDGIGFKNGQEVPGDYWFAIGYPESGSEEHLDFESRTIPAPQLPKLIILSPVEDAVVTDNPPTFQWQAVPGAQSYTVEFSQVSNFPPEVTQSATTTEARLTPKEKLAFGRWFWRVKALLPEGETDYASASFRQSLIPPPEGGEVVIEDFEDVNDWVQRVATLSRSEEQKHDGMFSMKVEFPALHGFVAVDTPITRLFPQTLDRQNPESAYVWVYPATEVEGPLQIFLQVFPKEGQPQQYTQDVEFTPDQTGTWVKVALDITREIGGVPANDPSNQIGLFSFSRPDNVGAATFFFDNLTLVYPKAQVPLAKCGDVNGDGKVAVTDALLALQFAVQLKKPSESQLSTLDFNGNGKVDLGEVIQVLQKAVNPAKTLSGKNCQ